MNTPTFAGFDHFHVHVRDRAAAESWYARVLGFTRVEALSHWAEDGGPLTLADAGRTVHLALFQRAPAPVNLSTLALRVEGAAFRAWQAHLSALLPETPSFEDHGLTLSIYFRDPDGNPFEITTWDVEVAR